MATREPETQPNEIANRDGQAPVLGDPPASPEPGASEIAAVFWKPRICERFKIETDKVTFSVQEKELSIPLPPAMGGPPVGTMDVAAMEAHASFARVKAMQADKERQAIDVGWPAITALLALGALVTTWSDSDGGTVTLALLVVALAIVIAGVVGLTKSQPGPYLHELARRWDEEAARARQAEQVGQNPAAPPTQQSP